MDLQKLIKMKSISQLCKSVERKQSKGPENMGLKITTIFVFNLLTIWNISKQLKQVGIYCSFDFQTYPFDTHYCDFHFVAADNTIGSLALDPPELRFGHWGAKPIPLNKSP